MRSFVFALAALVLEFSAGSAQVITPIGDINVNVDSTGLATPDLEAQVRTIEGVVQVAPGVIDPQDQLNPSWWYYVADSTGGVAVADPFLISQPVSVGDRVQVTTSVFTLRPPVGTFPAGTRTMNFGFAFTGQTIVLSSGEPVQDAVAIDATELLTNGAAYEGSRVRIPGLTVVDPIEWPSSGSSGLVRVTDGTSEIQLFVDDDTNLDEIPAPATTFEVVGFVAQSDVSPFDDGHFVYPTSTSDLFALGSGIVVVDPTSVVAGSPDLTLAFRLTGQDSALARMEIEIPDDWDWSSPGDLSLSGPGFTGASASFRTEGATFVVEVTGANVTASESGTVSVGSLTARPNVGSSVFIVRTAPDGGTLAQIASLPTVSVLNPPGVVVINEVFPISTAAGEGAAGSEESEFIELFNTSAVDSVDIGGWTLEDIGRTSECTSDAVWAFPENTHIPAAGYVVVCRTARDATASPVRGFLVDYALPPGVELFEMFDGTGVPGDDANDVATADLVLRNPTSGDDQIALLGGLVTNTGQCESVNGVGLLLPFAERVVLRDRSGQLIDVVEYREPGPCPTDLCSELTGPDDAYPYGPPKVGHTLGRDETSRDTDVSRDDLLPSSVPTPGLANVPGDTVPPVLILDEDGAALSGAVIELFYDELVDSLALAPERFSVFIPATGESVEVVQVLRDPEQGGPDGIGRHYFLVTEAIPAGAAATLTVSGVRDLEIGGSGGNELDTTASFTVFPEASTICEIQEFDEIGFSPLERDTVVVAGFVTLGDIPGVSLGEPPPTDRLSIWVQEPGGCGVNVFNFLSDDPAEYDSLYSDIREYGVELNDLVQIRGRVTEFVSGGSGAGAVTEIVAFDNDAAFYRFLLRGLEGPEPIDVTTGDAGDEALEGTLVHTEGTVINANSLAAYIDDGSGSIQVFQNFSSLDLTRFTVGDRLDVTGIITQFDSSEPYFSGYELVPQNQDAIFKVDGGFAQGGPVLDVDRRVLVPHLGESIEIRTTSPARSDVIIEIYDAVGRKITTLYDGIGLGQLTMSWDGVGQDGELADPGVYVCHLRAVALDGGSVRTETAPIVVGLPLDGVAR